MILITLFFSMMIICASSSSRSFFGYFTDDSISYSSVNIPYSSLKVDIAVWISATKTSTTFLILGINRVPTVSDNDGLFKLPKNGEVFQLTDFSPSKSVLYVGVWGGEMLHSYRYFGGSPTYYSSLVVSDIQMCNSDSQRGPFCRDMHETPISAVGVSSSNFVELGSITESQLRIPPGAEAVELTIAPILQKDTIKYACSQYDFGSHVNSSAYKLILASALFLSSDESFVNTCMDYSPVQLAELCDQIPDGGSSALSTAGWNVTLMADRPPHGVWTLRSAVSVLRTAGEGHQPESVSEQILAEKVSRGNISAGSRFMARSTGCHYTEEPSWSQGLAHTASRNDVFDACGWDADEMERSTELHTEQELTDSAAQIELQVQSRVHFCPSGYTGWMEFDAAPWSLLQTYKRLHCPQKFVDMSAYTTQNEALSYFIMTARTRAFSAPTDIYKTLHPATKTHGVFVSLRGRLDSLKFSPVGGVMFVQLVVLPSQTPFANGSAPSYGHVPLPTWPPGLLDVAFDVSLRYGAIAGQDVTDTLERNYREAGDHSLPAPNQLPLNETGGVRMFMAAPNSYVMSTDSPNDMMPVLGGVTGKDVVGAKFSWHVLKPRLGELAGMDETLYLHISPSTGSDPTAWASYYDLTVKVEFAMCSVKSHCVHGECMVQPGDVTVSYCSCRYPWAGDSCDELAESFALYILKVLVLVISNCAALPAVALALSYNLPVVAATLLCAGVSSGLYHLCDSDVYCIMGLSFGALQICDVLFATASMAMIAVHHCPWAAERRSAASLFLLAMLVSPVSNGPTDAAVIVLAILASVAILIIAWFDHFIGDVCRRNMLSAIIGTISCVLVKIDKVVVGMFTSHSRSQGRAGRGTGAIGAGQKESRGVELTESACDGGDGVMDSDTSVVGATLSVLASDEEAGEEPELYGGTDDSIQESARLLHQQSIEYTSIHRDTEMVRDRITTPTGNTCADKQEQYSAASGTICGRNNFFQDLWMSGLALLMVILAFVFYIGQNRTNYWISHGLWHACAMGSTYFFIRNRDSVVRRMEAVRCCCSSPDTIEDRSL